MHGNEHLRIQAGQGIAQVLFSSLSDVGDYGDGKYQNQSDAPVEAIGTLPTFSFNLELNHHE